jgi:hypothetical protein
MKSPDPCYKHAPDPDCPGCKPYPEMPSAKWDKKPSSVSECKPEWYYKGLSGTIYKAGVDPEVTCWKCGKTFLCDPFDASCRLCNAFFRDEPKPTTTPEERCKICNNFPDMCLGHPKPSVEKCECKFFSADEEGHPHCDECGAYAYGKKPSVEKCEHFWRMECPKCGAIKGCLCSRHKTYDKDCKICNAEIHPVIVTDTIQISKKLAIKYYEIGDLKSQELLLDHIEEVLKLALSKEQKTGAC